MRKIILFTCISLFLSTAIQAQNLNDVYQSMGEGDWEVALAQLEPIIAKKKKNYEARWLAAICHMERYRFEQSFELFKEAEPYAETDPFFFVPYAQAYLYSGNPEQAESVLKRASLSEIDDFFKKDYVKVMNQIRSAKRYMAAPEDVVVFNLGPTINTEGNEYSQVVTTDQRGIYFTARREGLGERADDGEYYEHLMKSRMNELDKWGKDEEIKGYNTGEDFIAPLQLLDNDSTILYFKNDDIFIGRMNAEGNYEGAEDLHINTDGWEAHAFLYNDENSIVFSSDRNSEEGKSDLFISHKQSNGVWSRPVALEGLNTEYNEDAPFVAEDGTLYFSSRGHDAMGGYDIFKTRLDSSTGKFLPPQNLGVPINLPGDDTFFTLYGQFAYFSSNRADGYGENDIYKVLMFNKAQIQGKLIDCGMTALSNAQISVKNLKTGELVDTTATEYGVYYLTVPVEQEVQVTITHKDEVVYDEQHDFRVLFRDETNVEHDFRIGGCDVSTSDIFLTMINSYDLDPLNLNLPEPSTEGVLIDVVEEAVAQTEVQEVATKEEPVIAPATTQKVVVAALPDIQLPIVYFDFDKSVVKEAFYKKLDDAAAILRDNPSFRILVAGHTDSFGDNQYNIALGLRRAQEVMDYMVNKGADPDQLEKGTFSEDIPIASNNTRRGRAYNRRVELSFIQN